MQEWNKHCVFLGAAGKNGSGKIRVLVKRCFQLITYQTFLQSCIKSNLALYAA